MSVMHRRLRYALDTGDFESLPENQPIEERDALLTLLTIYDLWLAPIDTLQGKEKYQNHPQVARLKWRLDEWLIGALDRRTSGSRVTEYDTAQAVRRIARQANDSIYDWLAASADWDQLVTFMAIEGGPDGGFDDAKLADAHVLLAARPDVPTLVALHHPPHATGLAIMDTMSLQQGLTGFAALIARHPQVQRVVCGHLHRLTLGQVAHAAALSAPSTAHQVALDLAPDAPLAITQEPAGWLIHAWGPGLPLVSHLAHAGHHEAIPDL